MTMNPDGTFTNNYHRTLAPYESSLNIVSPEFDLLTISKPLVDRGLEYIAARLGDTYARGRIIGRALNSNINLNRLPSVTARFRNSEWSNFLSTVNGDNYYRLQSKPGLVSTNTGNRNNGYFLSHTTPWEEFSGLGESAPIGSKVLYEFPTKTFGRLKSTTSNGVKTTYDVAQLGKQHLLYGNTSSGRRDFVRILSDKDAKTLDMSPYKMGVADRPLTPNGYYDNNPIYENIRLGNQTTIPPEVLNKALKRTSYSIYKSTPNGIQRELFIPK